MVPGAGNLDLVDFALSSSDFVTTRPEHVASQFAIAFSVVLSTLIAINKKICMEVRTDFTRASQPAG